MLKLCLLMSLSIIIGFALGNASPNFFTGYANSDECILAHIGDAPTNNAVNLIHRACVNQYSKPSKGELQILVDSTMAILTGAQSSWWTLSRSNKYLTKDRDGRMALRDQYFESAIAVHLPMSYKSRYRDAFIKATDRDLALVLDKDPFRHILGN